MSYKINIIHSNIDKEENKIFKKENDKSNSLKKLDPNKYKDVNNKISNNRFVMSKSYKKIDEKDDKK